MSSPRLPHETLARRREFLNLPQSQMLKVAIPKKRSEKELTIYELAKNKKCFDCASGKIPCFVVTKLWTFVCADCAPLLLEMNLICKSITSGTFSEDELLRIQNRNHQDLQQIFMKGHTKEEELRFPIPNGNNRNYSRSFLYEKYYKRRWFIDQEADQSNSPTKSQEQKQSKTNNFLLEDEIDEGDIKSFNNPNQFKRFGDYQNVHLASSPDAAEPFQHMEIKKSVSYSISMPVKPAPSSSTVTEGFVKEESTKKDPYAVFKSEEVKQPSLFAKFEEQRRIDEASDPYAAFRYASSTKSIFDSPPASSVFSTTTKTTSFPCVQPVSTLAASEDDDFGEFMGATTLVAQYPVATTTTLSKDNLLNADFSDLLKF